MEAWAFFSNNVTQKIKIASSPLSSSETYLDYKAMGLTYALISGKCMMTSVQLAVRMTRITCKFCS